MVWKVDFAMQKVNIMIILKNSYQLHTFSLPLCDQLAIRRREISDLYCLIVSLCIGWFIIWFITMLLEYLSFESCHLCHPCSVFGRCFNQFKERIADVHVLNHICHFFGTLQIMVTYRPLRTYVVKYTECGVWLCQSLCVVLSILIFYVVSSVCVVG